MSYASRFSVALLVVSISMLSVDSIAQQKSPHSVSFGPVVLPVTSIEPITADTSKITVFGEAFLVSKETAGQVVLDRYLQHFVIAPEGTASMLPSMVEEAVKRKDSSLIHRILVVAVEQEEPVEFAEFLFWKRLLHSSPARMGLSGVVSTRTNLGLKKKCAIVRALRSHGEVVPEVVMPLAGEAVECLPDIRRSLEEVFSNRATLSELRSRYSLDRNTFRENKYVSSAVDNYLSIIDALEKGLHIGEWEIFQDGLQLVGRQDGKNEASLSSKAAIFFIHRSVQSDRGVAALQALPFVTEQLRTPAVHKDIVSAIRALSLRNIRIVQMADIKEVLQFLARKDDEIRYELTQGLLRISNEVKTREELLFCNEVAQTFASDQLVAQVVRRDVAEALAQRVLEIGEREDALLIQNMWRGSLSFGTKIRIALFQWGIWQRRWFLIVLWCGISVWFLRIRAVHRLKAKQNVKEACTSRKRASGQRSETNVDELATLLAFFGLEPGATEKEIKNAYRRAVKQYHPDSGRLRDAGNEQFIKITGEYERLLKLMNERA